ncbi:MAG: protein BatD [Saprospiraceae bacterium]|nr:protein BatD [Saprospiraceae bacterium]
MTIESAKAIVDGKTIESSPIMIEVVQSASISELAKTKDIFIKTELEFDKAYIGQQVIVTFTLYSTQKILKVELTNIPEFSDGYTQFFEFSQFGGNIEVINGKQYYALPAARCALIPHKESQLKIEGLGVGLKVLETSGPFKKVVEKEVISEAVILNVVPLENKPENFTNAVGEFEFDAIITKSELAMNESSTLTLTITGTGDMKAIEMPKFGELEDYFEVYEPTMNVITKEENNKIIAQKVLTYLLVPKKWAALAINQFSNILIRIRILLKR